jgi:hypothetical protein
VLAIAEVQQLSTFVVGLDAQPFKEFPLIPVSFRGDDFG